jgi:beta-glucanase (GH16 family)
MRAETLEAVTRAAHHVASPKTEGNPLNPRSALTRRRNLLVLVVTVTSVALMSCEPAATVSAPAAAAACASLPKATGGSWTCTLDEEFNGTKLNRQLWVPQDTVTSGFHSGPECLVDSPNNISVANGLLTLTARKEAKPFDCSSAKEQFTTQYTSGEVSTYSKFSQAYGRFEVRAKLPATSIKGLQESLWLWPDDPTHYGAWPLSGEIDIAEIYSQYNDRAIPFVHYNNYLDTKVTNNACMISDVSQFHTYAVEWTPSSLTFIYDGRTCLVDQWSSLAPQADPQPFDKPFIVALSQVLGVGTNAFNPATTPLPATTQIDYVRVWK